MTALECYQKLSALTQELDGNSDLERVADKLRDVLDVIWYSKLTGRERMGLEVQCTSCGAPLDFGKDLAFVLSFVDAKYYCAACEKQE